jgi:type IV pilus assembly protein PilX
LKTLSKPRATQIGVSLVIVLIMLGVIALMSAATLRNASSNERVSNNFRMQVLAQQYAEAALRYCETQLMLADASRLETLKEANLVVVAGSTSPVWRQRASWTGTGGPTGGAASRTTVPESVVVSSDSAFKPDQLPDCVVEKQAVDGGIVYVITARGFSPDYTADARGFTVTGSVLWLQTLVAVKRSVVADPPVEPNLSSGTLADRTWRRILNPPIH